MKQKMKRFWTLDRHHDAGFTLVELIVVIAILAILGGVGIPAYNGYVKKANMQADISLISEIEQALTLAYYNGDLTDGSAGFLMLSPNEGESFDDYGNSLADSSLGGATALAMEKAFGSNWAATMQLKHDGWGIKNQKLSYEDAQAVVNSNYVGKYSPDVLMEKVQVLTTSVQNLNKAMFGDTTELYEMYNYRDAEGNVKGNVIADVVTDYYGDSKTWGDLNEVEQSNLLILATASSINSDDKSSSAENVISDFALYTAYAAENPEFNTVYEKFLADLPTVAESGNIHDIKSTYDTLRNAAGTGFSTWRENGGEEAHKKAFNAIMKGVDNAMADNGDAILGELGNANVFTTGIGNELYKDYLDTAHASAGGVGDGGIGDAVNGTPEGWVTVYYTVTNGKIYVDNTIPVNE